MEKMKKLLNWIAYNWILVHWLRVLLSKTEDRSFIKEFGFCPKVSNFREVEKRLAAIASYMCSNLLESHNPENEEVEKQRCLSAFEYDQKRYWTKYNIADQVNLAPSREDKKKWSWKDSLPREMQKILNDLNL